MSVDSDIDADFLALAGADSSDDENDAPMNISRSETGSPARNSNGSARRSKKRRGSESDGEGEV
jgi:hypothetical protein